MLTFNTLINIHVKQTRKKTTPDTVPSLNLNYKLSDNIWIQDSYVHNTGINTKRWIGSGI